jgi:hypothetical protein
VSRRVVLPPGSAEKVRSLTVVSPG